MKSEISKHKIHFPEKSYKETVKPQSHLKSPSIDNEQHEKHTVHWNARDGIQTTLQKPRKIFST